MWGASHCQPFLNHKHQWRQPSSGLGPRRCLPSVCPLLCCSPSPGSQVWAETLTTRSLATCRQESTRTCSLAAKDDGETGVYTPDRPIHSPTSGMCGSQLRARAMTLCGNRGNRFGYARPVEPIRAARGGDRLDSGTPCDSNASNRTGIRVSYLFLGFQASVRPLALGSS